MNSNFLAIDIGNSNISFGFFQAEKLEKVWRITTRHNFTADEFGISIIQFLNYFLVNPKDIQTVGISSVVPPLHEPVKEMTKRYFGLTPWWVGENLSCPVVIKTDNPNEVGADLVAGAYGAYILYGGPLIVIDFGTATTISAMSKNGEFIGTAIAPGIAISAEALFSRAAKLPRIQIQPPPSPIGKNTLHSMQSGFFYGFIGQVEKIIQKFQEEIIKEEIEKEKTETEEIGTKAKVAATGGLAELIANGSKAIDIVNPNLVLEGIHLAYINNIK